MPAPLKYQQPKTTTNTTPPQKNYDDKKHTRESREKSIKLSSPLFVPIFSLFHVLRSRRGVSYRGGGGGIPCGGGGGGTSSSSSGGGGGGGAPGGRGGFPGGKGGGTPPPRTGTLGPIAEPKLCGGTGGRGVLSCFCRAAWRAAFAVAMFPSHMTRVTSSLRFLRLSESSRSNFSSSCVFRSKLREAHAREAGGYRLSCFILSINIRYVLHIYFSKPTGTTAERLQLWKNHRSKRSHSTANKG